jgi:hypothetical protein
MAETSYAHRDLLQKLGIKPGTRVAFEGAIPPELAERVRSTEGVEVVDPAAGSLHIILLSLTDLGDAKPTLARLRKAIVPHGAIWVLTAKKGAPDYIKQETLIPLGKAVGLIDNKIASVDDATSAIRFVIPIAQRERVKPGPEI